MAIVDTHHVSHCLRWKPRWCTFAVIYLATITPLQALSAAEQPTKKAASRKTTQVVASDLQTSEVTVPANPNFTDTRIGIERITYQDPEFWPPTLQVVWQHNSSGDVYIAGIDPENGSMIPPGGQGALIGPSKKLVSLNYPGSFNGPEWGISRTNGLCLYYTLEDSSGFNQIARHSLSTHQTVFLSSGAGIDRCGVLPSDLATATFTGLITFNFQDRETWDPNWRFENQLNTDIHLPNALRGTSGPRWIPGRLQIVTNEWDANRTAQLAIYDTSTQQLRFITTGGDQDLSEGSPFFPPEFPGKVGIWALEGDNADKKLVLFVEGEPGQPYFRAREIGQPSYRGETINIFSLESMAYNGKSYIVFGGSPKATLPWVAENEVFIAGMDLDPIILTTPNDKSNCLDPEAVVIGDKFFVYYTIHRVFWVNEMHVTENFLPLPPEGP